MSHQPTYRVWDKQRNRFTEDGLLVLRLGGAFAVALHTKQGLYPIPDTGQKDLGLDRFILEQNTGLKAADGTTIFENDIIQFSICGATHGREREDGIVAPVWYCAEDACFAFGRYTVEKHTAPGGMVVGGWTWYYSMADEIDRATLKVLGNVHEHTSLLLR